MDKDSGTKGTPSQSDEEIKIEDLPNREATTAESEAAKGGYYSGPGGIISLGGGGLSDRQKTTQNLDWTMTTTTDGTDAVDEG